MINPEQKLETLFSGAYPRHKNVFIVSEESTTENQSQTNAVFSSKWLKYNEEEESKQEGFYEFQKNWYLTLYGFNTEENLRGFLKGRKTILDAGCGLGYKARWFAELSPETFAIGMDYSDSVFVAAEKYAHISNLVFVKGDIADTRMKDGILDYVSCDQVIHHTDDPEKTLSEFARILKKDRELAVYVYANKAVPRELLDDYFRTRIQSVSDKELWEMSEQLAELGRCLSELNASFDAPEIPLLGIQGGEIDIQRFIYWNCIKCFWNEDLGRETSISTNYDWYAPSNAKRYSHDEFLAIIQNKGLHTVTLHTEEACHSGRFVRKD